MQSKNAFISHIDESNELIPHDPNVYIQDFVITSSYIVLEVKKKWFASNKPISQRFIS